MEKSKTFKRMGNLVGIQAHKKSQRGIIARLYHSRIEKAELREFASKCKRITFRDIPINYGGRQIASL